MLHSSELFKTHRFTLAFLNQSTEMNHQRALAEKHLIDFRLGYLFALVVLIFKAILLIIYSIDSLEKREGTEEEKGSAANTGPFLETVLRATTEVATELERHDLVGEMITLVVCCLTLIMALMLSLRQKWFVQYHEHLNLVLFLVIGLVCVTLPNVVDSSVKSFSVVAEIYMLLFPFAILLRISFPRCVLGGWTVIVAFFVLHLATTPSSASAVSSKELVSVAVYLVLGVLAFNYVIYSQDKNERLRFELEYRDAVESGSSDHYGIGLVVLPRLDLNAANNTVLSFRSAEDV